MLLLFLRHLIRGGFHFEFPPSPSKSILPSPAHLVILFGNQMPKLSTTGFYNRQLALRCLWRLLGIARTCETWQVDVMSMVNNGISFIPNWVAWYSSLAVKSAPWLSIASFYILAPQSIISHIKAEECTQKVKTPYSCWARNLERACSTVGAVDPSPVGAADNSMGFTRKIHVVGVFQATVTGKHLSHWLPAELQSSTPMQTKSFKMGPTRAQLPQGHGVLSPGSWLRNCP
jgi:hypothetical protein